MIPSFDTVHDRRAVAECKKWHLHNVDVLPMWVADMDFAVPQPVMQAIQERLSHPVLGYALPTDGLRGAIVDTLAARHNWRIQPEDLVFLPGVDPGVNMAFKAKLKPGDGVVVQTPLYRPLLEAPRHWDLERIDVPWRIDGAGYAMHRGAMSDAMARARAFLLCNPHNPTGRVLSREELAFIAEGCERHDLLIVSDEIHCDLVYDGRTHIPIATLSPETAARTVTVMSGSKTFNIPGLKTAFAVVQDPALRRRFQKSRLGMVDSNNLLGLVATEAAYRSCEAWRQALVAYLQANRDHLAAEVARRLPGVVFQPPEATYLAWLDCSALGLSPNPYGFFLEQSRIGFSAGEEFGRSGKGHVRLNFGTPRALLNEALARMEDALASRVA